MSGSKMQATQGHSEACCNIPPIVGKGYESKGKYEDIAEMRTYVTGPSSAHTAILYIFDIFGFFPQSIQGADILATGDQHHQYQVFMPDFLDGQPADISVYPPDTPEKQKQLGAFFGGVGAPPRVAGRVLGVVKAMKEFNPNIKTVGVVGFCWGSKIVSMTAQSGTPFKAAAECHPGMIDPSEAANIDIPLCMLASGDEPIDDVRKFEAALKGPSHVEIFEDQIHGWMAARSDLSNQRVKEEYERGYKTLLEFFAKHL